MQVERISNPEDMARLRRPWNELAGCVPFRQCEWLFNWWNAYSEGRDLFVLVARDDDRRVVGIAPFFRECHLTGRRLIQLLGNGKACSEYQSLLVRDSDIDRVSLAFARWLAAASAMRDHGWDQCEMGAVAEGDLAVEMLRRRLADFHVVSSIRADDSCWCLDLPGSWEEFVQTLTKHGRRKFRTLQRRYLDTGRARCRLAATNTDIEHDFDHLVELHERRWSNVGQAGCFSHFGFERFLHGAVRDLAREGRLHFNRLEIDGETAAVSCAFAGGNRHYLYQCGVDPTKMEHQPGWLLTISVLQNMIETGVRQYDFLRGDERYKRELGARQIPQVQVHLAAPHTRGRFHHQVWVTQDALRNWGHQVATAIRG